MRNPFYDDEHDRISFDFVKHEHHAGPYYREGDAAAVEPLEYGTGYNLDDHYYRQVRSDNFLQ